MNLPQVVSNLTIAAIMILPLAFTTGCTGPPPGASSNTTGNQPQTSTPAEVDNDHFSDVYSNTTN